MQIVCLLLATVIGVGLMSAEAVKYVSDDIIRTYEEAVNNCTELRGVLPTGRDRGEIEELRKWANPNRTSFWLNGKEDADGEYCWQDGRKDRIDDTLWYEGHVPWCHKCCRVTLHFNDDINDGKLFATDCGNKAGFICVIRN